MFDNIDNESYFYLDYTSNNEKPSQKPTTKKTKKLFKKKNSCFGLFF